MVPSSGIAQSGDTLRSMYVKFLGEKGYKPKVDKDGDVLFYVDDRTYFIDVHEKDVEFFMVALANIWPIESATERAKVLKAVSEVNANAKGAKVYMKEDDVWVTLEMFVADPRDYSLVFDRVMESIDQAVDMFIDEMRE